mmetsp:Transcript_39976/g.85149  ORF Transcript_39976/g.85149 Transcript_39976/m.85149 type:complete len:88 (-) Transcript_39976:1368-1631(-)
MALFIIIIHMAHYKKTKVDLTKRALRSARNNNKNPRPQEVYVSPSLVICLHAVSIDVHVKIFTCHPLVQAEKIINIPFEMRARIKTR